jgi:RNA 2',3'-cyclic 3'-phosphodiesterase
MARLRTFIALPLEKPIRDRLVTLQERLAATGNEVKWVEHANLHVTLLFLGEVDERDVTEVCRAVVAVCQEHEGFPLSVERVGCFPNVRRPRTLWVGIGDGTQEICALHDALEPPLLDLGCYRREERQYTPHVTLGRIRGDRAGAALVPALQKQAAWQAGRMPAGEIHVLSSELTSDGPVYTVLSRAKLAGAGRADAANPRR